MKNNELVESCDIWFEDYIEVERRLPTSGGCGGCGGSGSGSGSCGSGSTGCGSNEPAGISDK
jgi:hypothetical protein